MNWSISDPRTETIWELSGPWNPVDDLISTFRDLRWDYQMTQIITTH